MRSIRFFFALIIFVGGVTTSLRADAVTVTDEYDNPIQTDQELLFMGGVAHPADLLVSGGSRELASILKNKRILETAGIHKSLAKDYDPDVAEVESFKAKTSFYDLMLVASENQNTEGKRELEEMPKNRASIMAAVTDSAPVKPITPVKPLVPRKPFSPQNPMAPLMPAKPRKPILPVKPASPRKPTAPLMPAAPKKPAKPIGCPSGLKYNTCCQGCGAVFSTNDALISAVYTYNTSNTSSNGNINCWDVSQVTDMSWVFYYYSSMNERIDCWNTGQVTNMFAMFYGAGQFNQPLNQWNTSRVTVMHSMFDGASIFNQPLDQWDVRRVKDMMYMFSSASTFNQPLNQWNTTAVKSMYGMFFRTSSFNQPLSQWNVGKVTDMCAMFESASNFNQNLCPWYETFNAVALNGGCFNNIFRDTNCSNKTDPDVFTKKNFCANCYR